MRKGWFLFIVISLCLVGCQSPGKNQETFLVGEWLNALDQQFGYIESDGYKSWLEGLSVSESSVLTKEIMSVTLARAMGMEPRLAQFENADDYSYAKEIQALLEMGYVELEDGYFQGDDIVNKQAALDLLEKANNDYTQFTFPSTHYEVNYTQDPLQSPIDLEGKEGTIEQNTSINESGLYQVENRFYWVDVNDEKLTYRQASLDEIIQELELQTTFSPDLSEGIQLEEKQAKIDQTVSPVRLKPDLIPLKSHYFSFSIKGLDVSGHVSSSSLEVTLGGKLNGFEIEDTFSISDLKITADASLNPFAKQNLLLRVDYQIDNIISAGKKKSNSLNFKEIKAEDLATIRSKIESITGQSLVQNELDIVTFAFPIPGTLQMMQVGLNLKLYIGLNGEVGLAFSSSQSHGIKVVDGKASRIQRNEHSIQPYIEGSAELTSGLSVDLRGFGYSLVDFVVETGVGAEARTQVHYVNTREKVVDSPVYEASLTELEAIASQYQGSQEAFIDLCADVDLYWLVRLRIGSSSTLVSRFGLSGSWTPIKKVLSLLHLENHRNVGSCTRDYTFVEENDLPQGLHLSSQTLSLQPGQTAQLTMSDANGAVSASFYSDNPNIASVSSDGLVEAHLAGITVIKATSSNGITLSCVVYIPQDLEVEFSPLSTTSFFIFYNV